MALFKLLTRQHDQGGHKQDWLGVQQQQQQHEEEQPLTPPCGHCGKRGLPFVVMMHATGTDSCSSEQHSGSAGCIQHASSRCVCTAPGCAVLELRELAAQGPPAVVAPQQIKALRDILLDALFPDPRALAHCVR